MKKKDNKREIINRALIPFGTSIFTEMTSLANACGAVNLSQGFPDFDGPEEIRARAAQALMRGPNQYAPSSGIMELRNAVAHKMMRFYGVNVDAENEVTVTSGATEGLCATLLGILEPGDEVILLEPCFDSYAPVAAMAGAEIRYIPLMGPDFVLPRHELIETFSSKTKAIIINSPQNPCGKVFSREDLIFIAGLCEKYDAYVIGDEVYEHMVYDGREHITLLSIPELRERAFVISSTAKTFSMTGWKIGYVVAAPELSRAVRMSHQFITFCGQAPLQEAMGFAIGFPDSYYRELLTTYSRRREWLCQSLKDIGFQVYPPEGTYYVLVDIRSIGFDDDLEFCRMLPEKAGVAAIPCSCFWNERRYGREYVRFCFCKKDETLEEGIKRLKRWMG
ncbi:MAG TPA: methionine aminotransferase [Desulfobacteraceae bacterium]|nr:methionine aminotransferase [Desulfobacteraceae bacterium]HPJ66599.1 methionine aminotransferase [Desulfobacteraceae bacterium]HPQ27865.1 methionine aminotransferase [Desulfobacteraceae bacterium]